MGPGSKETVWSGLGCGLGGESLGIWAVVKAGERSGSHWAGDVGGDFKKCVESRSPTKFILLQETKTKIQSTQVLKRYIFMSFLKNPYMHGFPNCLAPG